MSKTKEIMVPLNRLTGSDSNVRKTPADGTSDAELKASLATHGLLQNLIVHESDEQEGYYEVDAGHRRVRQLRALVDDGVFEEDMAVACLLLEDSSRAVEVSLAENTMRADMHPADEVEAFVQLVSEGNTVAEIAMKFGMAERAVEQRLRLGNVAPALLDAYRAGELNLDTLKGFAVTADHDAQLRVWRTASEQWGYLNQRTIKGMLLNDRVQGTSRLAVFVGIETYEEAGGLLIRDLFGDEDDGGLRLEDYALVHQLAEKKLKAAAKEIEDDWRWVEYSLQFEYAEEAKFQKVYPTRGKLNSDEQAEYDRLTDARDLMFQSGLNDDNREEYESVNEDLAKLWQLKKERTVYSKAQRELAGCMVTLDYNGKLRVVEGLVRPGDVPKGKGGRDSGGYKDAETIVREKAGYSKKMMDAMRDERTRIVRSHLSGSFSEAFDLLVYQMARATFSVETYYSHALDVKLFDFGDRQRATEALEVNDLPLDWMHETDQSVAFEQMRSLSDEDKQAIFAACVSATYSGQLTIDAYARPRSRPLLTTSESTSRPASGPRWTTSGAGSRRDAYLKSRKMSSGLSGLMLIPGTRRQLWRRRWRLLLPQETTCRKMSRPRAGKPRWLGRHPGLSGSRAHVEKWQARGTSP